MHPVNRKHSVRYEKPPHGVAVEICLLNERDSSGSGSGRASGKPIPLPKRDASMYVVITLGGLECNAYWLPNLLSSSKFLFLC